MHHELVEAINGEESPLQKYIFELKQYKKAHPERYLQIEQAKDEWEIAQATSGTAYFVVKAPRSARLGIRIRKEEDGQKGTQIISLLELLEEMRVDENAKATYHCLMTGSNFG